jgi:hypothetical protein
MSTSSWSSTNALRFQVFLASSSAGKSGDTRLCGCRLSRWRKDEFCTSTSFASDPDLDLDPGLVVLVAQLAIWAAVILPRLFSKATTLVNWI